jgi:hypothetical protein
MKTIINVLKAIFGVKNQTNTLTKEDMIELIKLKKSGRLMMDLNKVTGSKK